MRFKVPPLQPCRRPLGDESVGVVGATLRRAGDPLDRIDAVRKAPAGVAVEGWLANRPRLPDSAAGPSTIASPIDPAGLGPHLPGDRPLVASPEHDAEGLTVADERLPNSSPRRRFVADGQGRARTVTRSPPTRPPGRAGRRSGPRRAAQVGDARAAAPRRPARRHAPAPAALSAKVRRSSRIRSANRARIWRWTSSSSDARRPSASNRTSSTKPATNERACCRRSASWRRRSLRTCLPPKTAPPR